MVFGELTLKESESIPEYVGESASRRIMYANGAGLYAQALHAHVREPIGANWREWQDKLFMLTQDLVDALKPTRPSWDRAGSKPDWIKMAIDADAVQRAYEDRAWLGNVTDDPSEGTRNLTEEILNGGIARVASAGNGFAGEVAAEVAAMDRFIERVFSIPATGTLAPDPAARSCPTCGPCPGGPGSTPLNETDALCWRCGRTDLT